jgi:nucleotide-binding universal stress UspA family protein
VREILLHGSTDEVFDESVSFARRLAESFEARLHVVYTVEDPLSAGWTSEVSADRLPEVHQAMAAEARERLARVIPLDDQERLGVEIVLRTGPAIKEILSYANDHAIDLAIVQARGDAGTDLASGLLDHAQCALLVLR